MSWRSEQLQKTLKKKYKSIITVKLKDTWLKIIEN